MSSDASHSHFNKSLLKHTSVFGIRLWILILSLSVVALLLLLISVSIFFIFYYRRRSFGLPRFGFFLKPYFGRNFRRGARFVSSFDRRLLSFHLSEVEMEAGKEGHEAVPFDRWMDLNSGAVQAGSAADFWSISTYNAAVNPETARKMRFTLEEIEAATDGFSGENVIGFGDEAIVYRGVLLNNVRVAVKRLMSGSLEDEEFKQEMEVFVHVRHRSLVKLLGYCLEGNYRMLVYEYVDNGNLQQWLHGYGGTISPLTWSRRINIIRAIAKGLAYLHEDIEPKIIHGNIKSNKILLDHQWHPRVSDIGSAELPGLGWPRVTAEKLGCVSPEPAVTGNLTEKTDIYCFGVLVMETISGRPPVDETQPQVYLIDWLKSMITEQKIAYILDPKIPDLPSSKELKRIILVALRCVDPDVNHRPRMGDVVHMLEPRDLLLGDARGIKEKETSYTQEENLRNATVLYHSPFEVHK